MVIRLFLVPFVAATDAAAPEVPRGSHFLVWKLARSFAPNDLIAYARDGHASLGRVVVARSDAVEVSRNGTAPVLIPRADVLGKVVSIYWRASDPRAGDATKHRKGQ